MCAPRDCTSSGIIEISIEKGSLSVAGNICASFLGPQRFIHVHNMSDVPPEAAPFHDHRRRNHLQAHRVER